MTKKRKKKVYSFNSEKPTITKAIPIKSNNQASPPTKTVRTELQI